MPIPSNSRQYGGVKTALLLVSVAALGVAGYAGYRVFFNRAGESAISLIPADASVVVTLDTNPSANQLHAYQTISDSLKKEGVDEKVSEGISGMLGKAGIAQELRQYVKSSFALAMWVPDEGASKKPTGVVLLSVSDSNQVSKILSTVGTPGAGDTRSFHDMSMAVVGSYLVLSNDAAMVARVEAVSHGSEPSMSTVQEFQLARADLPSDANLMVFASPKAIKAFGKAMPNGGANNMDGFTWASFGATLRDDGMQFDMRAPFNANASPAFAKMASLKPLESSSYRHLPSGAYGVLAYSSPGTMWEMTDAQFQKNPQIAEKLNKGVEEFEKHSGLSIPNDLVPALKGDMLFAAYPSANGEAKSADFVLVASNNNGANPVALAEKAAPTLEKLSEGKAKFVKTTENGATVYALAPESQQQMLQSMSPHREITRTLEVTPGQPATPSPTESNPVIQNSTPESVREVPPALKGKTITWAEVDGCVIVASSKEMLTKVIASFHGAPTLADDTAFAPSLAKCSGDQSAMIVSMKRVMDAIRPFAGEAMDRNSGGPSFDDVSGIFGDGDAAMFLGGKYDGKVGSGTWFIPLNFDRVAQLVHKGMHSSHQEPYDSTMPATK